MNRSRIGRLLLAVVALTAVVAGAGGGWAASVALSRAVGDVSRSMSEFRPEDRISTGCHPLQIGSFPHTSRRTQHRGPASHLPRHTPLHTAGHQFCVCQAFSFPGLTRIFQRPSLVSFRIPELGHVPQPADHSAAPRRPSVL